MPPLWVSGEAELMNYSRYRDLTYPLNVYACVLAMEEGQVDNLHYGLFDETHPSLPAAQNRSTELILQHLPPPPCRLLEIGCGLGATLQELNKQGYQSLGITPDAAQIRIVHERLGDQAKVVCVAFEELAAAPGCFDVILLQESAQYLSPLMLFNKAYDLLADGGELLVLDEFALKRVEPGLEGLHQLRCFVAQAMRCGFLLEHQLDLSQQAAPTVEYLLRVIPKHRSALLSSLAIPERWLDELLASLTLYRRKYAEGRFGYALLRLRRGPTPRWRIAASAAEDEPAIRQLFEKVFAQPLSPALFQWKYGGGRGRAVVARREGQLAAHYGGVSRPISYRHSPAQAYQITDVMVAPAERGVLTRKGPFFLTAASFAEMFVGFGTDHLLAFGFPNARAMRVGERLELYAEVGQLVEVYWPPEPGRLSWNLSRQRLKDPDDASFQRCADALWGQMRRDLPNAIVGVRDAAWLQYRYLSHPDQDYWVLLVSRRLPPRALGIVVLRQDDQRAELLDLVAPLNHIPLLVRVARHLASEWGVAELYCWISSTFAELFERCEGERRALNVSIPMIRWCEGPAPQEVCDRWWLMSGDTDFR